MDLVSPYPGIVDFVDAARTAGHDLFIVSHKTKTPILGPAYDMHEAARGFLGAQAILGEARIPAGNIFFELTKEEKIARAAALGCTVFIDDLPEILAMSGFPEETRRVLFDPDMNPKHSDLPYERHSNWAGIRQAILSG
jgi:hypothetical protein